jgi:two-component system chemotaxis response regulator CheY
MLNRVLIVDDSNLHAEMCRIVFSSYKGCALEYATNGLDALEKLEKSDSFDLIILDINMPKMDGITFLQSMKRNGHDGIPVIVVSTEDKKDDIVRALKAGAKGYVKKPWKPNQIRELIDKLVPSA